MNIKQEPDTVTEDLTVLEPDYSGRDVVNKESSAQVKIECDIQEEDSAVPNTSFLQRQGFESANPTGRDQVRTLNDSSYREGYFDSINVLQGRKTGAMDRCMQYTDNDFTDTPSEDEGALLQHQGNFHSNSSQMVVKSEVNTPMDSSLDSDIHVSEDVKDFQQYLPTSDDVLPNQQDQVKVYKCGTCPYSSNLLFDLYQHNNSNHTNQLHHSPGLKNRTSPGSLAEADVEAPPSRKRSRVWESRTRSRVWELIERKDSLRCFCTICKTVFKHKKGASTGTFKRHLETKHPAEWEEVIRPVEHTKQSAGATSVSTQLTQPGVVQAVESRKKLATDSQRKNELDRLVLQMICLDIQPFSVVSNKGFRKLVQALDARYDLPDKKTLRKKLLPEMYHEAKSELQGQLNKAKFLAISTDTWTSTDDMGFLTVTAHFIDERWQLLSKVLETTNLTVPHTAENLSEALKAIFCKWGIQDKIACIVSDNCANIVKAVRKLKYPHVACFAHTLQSVINDCIGHCQEVLQLRKRVQSVASYFHSSAIASDKLKEVQIQNHREPKKLKQDVLTLWNSTLSMLERYNEEHEMVVTALCMLGKPQKCLTSDELELSNNVVQCLKPFEFATKELSADKQTTASKVIPIVAALQYSLMRPELQSFTFAQILQQELHRRFDGWEQDGIHGQCTYLDPRFKKLGFDDESVVRSIEADLTKQIQGLMGNEEPPATTSQQQNETINKTLWGLFDAKVKKYDAARKQPMSHPLNELRKYDEELLQDRKGDPCDWWQQNMQLLPNLSLIAHQYMCIPATSVPAERLFSKAGEVLSARISCLKPETANMVLFLNKSSFYC